MMFPLQSLKPVDYLLIGHITLDITPHGTRIGGTAAFAGLTAHALGLRVGIVTSWGAEEKLGALNQIPIVSYPTEQSTTFENIKIPDGRLQIISHVAPNLDANLVPDPWHNARIVHIAPVAQEVEPNILRYFPSAMIGITPQGWLRSWNSDGEVYQTEWPEAIFVLNQSGAAVISIEDIARDEARIEEMAASCHVLAVTEAYKGSRVYWNGDVRRFSPPQFREVDSTGAGDIYAAAFFFRLYDTRDPWEAGRFATQLSAYSISREGLDSIPNQEEIQECMLEVF
jgi:sugar/nucleoside kinase (ribokinase family)